MQLRCWMLSSLLLTSEYRASAKGCAVNLVATWKEFRNNCDKLLFFSGRKLRFFCAKCSCQMWINIRSDYIVGIERSDATFLSIFCGISLLMFGCKQRRKTLEALKTTRKTFVITVYQGVLDNASMGTWLAFSEQEKVLLESKHF